MSGTLKFYTEEQKEELRKYSYSKNATRNPITESTGRKDFLRKWYKKFKI